jgi:hypothetical protein
VRYIHPNYRAFRDVLRAGRMRKGQRHCPFCFNVFKSEPPQLCFLDHEDLAILCEMLEGDSPKYRYSVHATLDGFLICFPRCGRPTIPAQFIQGYEVPSGICDLAPDVEDIDLSNVSEENL